MRYAGMPESSLRQFANPRLSSIESIAEVSESRDDIAKEDLMLLTDNAEG